MAPFAIALEEDRKYFLQKPIDSVYMLMWPRGYWWNHSLNGYLAGRCFYDVTLNPYDLIHDYARHYYGPQAGALLGPYFEEWARRPNLSYHVRGDSTPAERATLAEQRSKWIAPAIEAAKGEPLLLYRVAKVEKLHTLAERLMDLHRRREEIQELRRAGQFDQAAKLIIAARTQADAVAAMFNALADLKQGLTEHADPTFIGGNLRNWIEDESKLVAAKRAHHDR